LSFSFYPTKQDTMAAAELRAENERLAREIHKLLSANTTLEKEMLALDSEREALEAAGTAKVKTLEVALETVDAELSSLRSQCQSMTQILMNAAAENDVDEADEEPAPLPVGRKLSTASTTRCSARVACRCPGSGAPRPWRWWRTASPRPPVT
jgi:hypothetical protein